MPISSSLSIPGQVEGLSISPDGRCVAVACNRRSGWIQDLVPHLASTPGWLVDLAEAVVGVRRDAAGGLSQVPSTAWLQLRDQLEGTVVTADPDTAWLAWFLADRTQRSVGPVTTNGLPTLLELELELARRGEAYASRRLKQLRVSFPEEGLLYSRSALIQLEEYQFRPNPLRLREAAWLSQRGLELAPEEAGAHWARARYLQVSGATQESLAYLRRATHQPGARPELWLELARWEADAGELEHALQACGEAVALAEAESNGLPRLGRARLAHSKLLARLGRKEEALADHRAAYGITVPTRDPTTPPELIDLSDFYNANLDLDWSGACRLNHSLAHLPRGRTVLDGVEFDVRGGIHLINYPAGTSAVPYPDAAVATSISCTHWRRALRPKMQPHTTSSAWRAVAQSISRSTPGGICLAGTAIRPT